MNELQIHKGNVFRDLHTSDDIFVMPNAWNAGSACMLEEAGFYAIGTTSAGIAFGMGLPDYEGTLSRDAALEETQRISTSVKVPVSADAENGYGHEAAEVAETIQLFADAGAVGASIEDYAASFGGGLYMNEHSLKNESEPLVSRLTH
ncbi:isocitrate lyase/phosphoenolpyruvate mutase family protein [Halomonas sp. EF61]|uniref:isocitrate lyase/phosphoenolpyruvate mutase family protein n=1 Tax=Halomonas sp. EF61 TaxID=2950869 RepID=UPI0032DFE2EC